MEVREVSVILFILLLRFSTAYQETRHDFRYVSYQDLQTSINTFSNSSISEFSQILFDVSRNQLIVGAKDTICRVAISDLKPLECIRWEAPREKAVQCANKGQSEQSCHNYIKILLTNGRLVLACGTNAFSPSCTWRDIEDIGQVVETVPGIARAPYSPQFNCTGIISDSGDYYFGGPSDFSGSDSLISKITDNKLIRTKHSDGFWLNEPQFVGSFESDKFIYFVFRETAVEYINCGKVVYSRIARICKNDSGGSGQKDSYPTSWKTFIKARLNCSISGEYPFYFNEIQSMTYLTEENVVYATFTTSPNSIAGSAVCAFNLTAINAAFSGPFKYRPDIGSAWNEQHNAHKDHFECKTQPQNTYMEMEISKYQLMNRAVEATTLDPLHVGELERFTHITVDTVQGRHGKVHVLYVTTLTGFIKKFTVLPSSKETCLIETWQAMPDPSMGITNMKFLKDTNSIYITTRTGLMQISAQRCYRHTSKDSCFNAMDPYCGWDEIKEKCTAEPFTNMEVHSWEQPILKCPVLTATVDGGWSSWSEWEPCRHRIGSSEDRCLCQHRKCNNPAPAHGGQECKGPSIAVSNCTVHGDWSQWSAWSACSATCGSGLRSRTRTCSNPAPAFGGRVCVGSASEVLSCSETPCPRDGGWSEWDDWSSCTVSCGGGFRIRSRKCNQPVPENGGQYCIGNNVEYEECNKHHCNEAKKAHFTPWYYYNYTRGKHRKRLKVTCKAPVSSMSQIKIAVKEETQICDDKKCIPMDDETSLTPWSSWGECSKACGGGRQNRTRVCRTGTCHDSLIEFRECNKEKCNWGCWSEWSPCNVSCGWGVKVRTRACMGTDCEGASFEEAPCEAKACGGQLGWEDWSEWTKCDKNNHQYRTRKCTSKNPGQKMCQGGNIETRLCLDFEESNAIASTVEESCTSGNVALFILGLIFGLMSFVVYFLIKFVKNKKNVIPSSPHYITAEQNPYISVPTRDKSLKKYVPSSNGTAKTKFDFDLASISTLKRNSHEVKNGHSKYDDTLYE